MYAVRSPKTHFCGTHQAGHRGQGRLPSSRITIVFTCGRARSESIVWYTLLPTPCSPPLGTQRTWSLYGRDYFLGFGGVGVAAHCRACIILCLSWWCAISNSADNSAAHYGQWNFSHCRSLKYGPTLVIFFEYSSSECPPVM